MEKGYTKKVMVCFDLDHDGNIVDGSVEGQRDSRFVGVTVFTPEGEKSFLNGKKPAVPFMYDSMSDEQKIKFDNLVQDWNNLK